MKYNLLVFSLFLSFSFYCQKSSKNKADTTAKMTFTCTFHSNVNYEDGTEYFKDGYCRTSDCSIIHINEFLISVSPEIAKRFDGKKVKVTGVYKINTGNRNRRQNSKNGESDVYQGSEEDSFLFISPNIQVLEK